MSCYVWSVRILLDCKPRTVTVKSMSPSVGRIWTLLLRFYYENLKFCVWPKEGTTVTIITNGRCVSETYSTQSYPAWRKKIYILSKNPFWVGNVWHFPMMPQWLFPLNRGWNSKGQSPVKRGTLNSCTFFWQYWLSWKWVGKLLSHYVVNLIK